MTITTYEWLNREKERYYVITIQQDDTNNIMLNYRWGGLNSNRGGKKALYVQTEESAQKIISKMIKRRKSRGYDLLYTI